MCVSSIEVLYSDSSIIVVNKPSGLLSVPGKGPDKRDCVVRRAQDLFPTVRVVHRLDCATSGLMLLALTAEAQSELSRQFQQREVEKQYIAIVSGKPETDQGSVELPLITDWPNRPRQMVDHERGKPALTHYTVDETFLKNGLEVSRVILKPVTGRSHQLRVHMLSIGHPILGDGLYAEGDALSASDRLLLHAESIRFTHPVTGNTMEHQLVEPF